MCIRDSSSPAGLRRASGDDDAAFGPPARREVQGVGRAAQGRGAAREGPRARLADGSRRHHDDRVQGGLGGRCLRAARRDTRAARRA
eukprot:2161384-Prymnesium_polylepis.1